MRCDRRAARAPHHLLIDVGVQQRQQQAFLECRAHRLASREQVPVRLAAAHLAAARLGAAFAASLGHEHFDAQSLEALDGPTTAAAGSTAAGSAAAAAAARYLLLRSVRARRLQISKELAEEAAAARPG